MTDVVQPLCDVILSLRWLTLAGTRNTVIQDKDHVLETSVQYEVAGFAPLNLPLII